MAALEPGRSQGPGSLAPTGGEPDPGNAAWTTSPADTARGRDAAGRPDPCTRQTPVTPGCTPDGPPHAPRKRDTRARSRRFDYFSTIGTWPRPAPPHGTRDRRRTGPPRGPAARSVPRTRGGGRAPATPAGGNARGGTVRRPGGGPGPLHEPGPRSSDRAVPGAPAPAGPRTALAGLQPRPIQRSTE